MQTKPFSQACENNKTPILEVLTRVFADHEHVLEIGAGTGQHAVFFARKLTHLLWQASDRPEYITGIQAWYDDCPSVNLLPLLTLDVLQQNWPKDFDAVYTANTLHIMEWDAGREMIQQAGKLLPQNGKLVIYGPFNYGGRYTSDSNRQFDEWLREQHPQQGIRDFDDVDMLAQASGLALLEDNPMPANNRLLVWHKR